MSLKATLGANVTRLIVGRTDTKLCHVWTDLAAEGWPGEGAANRAANLKRIARGKLWPGPENLTKLAGVLGVEPWELLRPAVDAPATTVA